MESRKKLCSLNGEDSNKSREKPDKLSNLPEPILHHILSFLDMKYVVQTSVLSRRWRYLWFSLPFLSFNYVVFLKCLESVSPTYRYKNFVKFVDRVLLFRDSSIIQKFCLIWDGIDDSCNESHIDSWIRVAIWRNVQELHLNFYPINRVFEFPHCLFTSKSLTSLRLSSGIDDPFSTDVKLPVLVNLPALKILHCTSIDFSMNGDFFEKLLLGSPSLETLILRDCSFTKSLKIFSPQLKKLKIRYCCDQDFVIRAPNLVIFIFVDFTRTSISLKSDTAPEIVSLDVEAAYQQGMPVWEDGGSNRMIKCLKELYNVKNLALSAPFIEVISELPFELKNWPTPFNNLRCLHLQTWLTSGCFRSTMFLLENSPNVETLAFDVYPEKEYLENTAYGRLDLSRKLKLYHLKFVEFHSIRGCELEYLEVLLKSAVTLMKMTLSISEEWAATNEPKLKAYTEEVLALPRASSDVTIEILDNSTIQKFRLVWEDDDCDSSHIDSWIRVAIWRNVKELYLQFYPKNGAFKFPHCLFTSKSLTSLTLISGSEDLFKLQAKLPDVVYLPALKILHCKSIDFSLDVLLLGSPALDALILVDCIFMDCIFMESRILNISSPQLKQLEIRCSFGADFIISAPRLVKFYWKGLMRTECSIENQSTLEIVTLDMDISPFTGLPAFEDGDGNRMIKCLKGLYNVKHLKLSAALLEAISQHPSQLENWAIPFSNLRYLCLETWLTRGCFQSIMFLLEKSLNVETLVLRVSSKQIHIPNMIEQGKVLKLNKLKYVEFQEVIGCLDELEYLKVLLDNAVTLKKMAIIRTSWKQTSWMVSKKTSLTFFTEDVLALPRASSDVKISFS
ncbi:F-box protein [Thalictrum thalictroides]|uniref:F-box protein n=1 Tax=Thalictrum thalictroides TaxID=46969 RepID=A0A7J6WVM9_THATH|nr:F-box protein [Thalictrum thalictroides]